MTKYIKQIIKYIKKMIKYINKMIKYIKYINNILYKSLNINIEKA